MKHRPLKRNAGTPEALCLIQLQCHWFLQPEVMGTSLPPTPVLRGLVWAGTPGSSGEPLQLRYPSQLLTTTHGCGASQSASLHLQQSLCGCFFMSLVIELLFS